MHSTDTHLKQQYLVVLDETLCDGCRKCLPACSFTALIWVRADNALLIDTWACTGCGTCMTACPNKALTLRPRGPT